MTSKPNPLLCRPTVGHQNYHHACTAHALLLHTVTVYNDIDISTQYKEAKYNRTSSINTVQRDVFNQYNLVTLLAIELDHTTTIDLKLDWRDVRAVISLLSCDMHSRKKLKGKAMLTRTRAMICFHDSLEVIARTHNFFVLWSPVMPVVKRWWFFKAS